LLPVTVVSWMDGVESGYSAATADPSTSLRFGRDDKGRAVALRNGGELDGRESRAATPGRLQIPPLRYATVGMTKGGQRRTNTCGAPSRSCRRCAASNNFLSRPRDGEIAESNFAGLPDLQTETGPANSGHQLSCRMLPMIFRAGDARQKNKTYLKGESCSCSEPGSWPGPSSFL
jgi:hypothetical protein